MAAMESVGRANRSGGGHAAGLAGHVGLGFDDAPARAALGGIAHERLADEKARERGGIDRQLGALQPPEKRVRPPYNLEMGFDPFSEGIHMTTSFSSLFSGQTIPAA